ncbi:MAG: YlxR family protein [Hamadaea sp.]|uniref:YlxR family protein n=1 Tax=Hamadaea sp. NPDC050747 TaxID=3155789 RepID=UPI0017AB4F13|nr:YlxR family protein [Hamadaea sp.]NUR49822.1 YlxR family protein [Hamadaea sp.]NUT06562.1 YlxR family protein [Hamadaea sp.]
MRTCVGCRQRAAASELLRFVAIAIDSDPPGSPDTGGSRAVRVVPDPTRRAPGRGAHLHPVPACLALAEKRRAFGRALRVAGLCDVTALSEAIHGGKARLTGS